MDGKPLINKKSLHLLSDPGFDSAEYSKEPIHVPTKCEKCCFNLATCCGSQCMIKFRRNKPNCAKFLCYTIALYFLILIGGFIFHYCEYNNEKDLISEKQLLISEITQQLNNTTYTDKLERLISLSDVPTEQSKNRLVFPLYNQHLCYMYIQLYKKQPSVFETIFCLHLVFFYFYFLFLLFF